jgi:hypothetical protein
MTHYELLQISPDSSAEDIGAALDEKYNYWRLLVNHHSDEQRLEAQTNLRAMEQARATLLNPAERARYDSLLLGRGEDGLSLPPQPESPTPLPPPNPDRLSAQAYPAVPIQLDPSACPNAACGATGNPTDARFCFQCRTALTQECPNAACRRELRWFYKACTYCGCDIEAEHALLAAEAARIEAEYHVTLQDLLDSAEDCIRQGAWVEAREVFHAFEGLGIRRWERTDYMDGRSSYSSRDSYGWVNSFEELPLTTRLGWEVVCPTSRPEWKVARDRDADCVLSQARQWADRYDFASARRMLTSFEGLGIADGQSSDHTVPFDTSTVAWQTARQMDLQWALNDIERMLRQGRWRSANESLAAFEGLGSTSPKQPVSVIATRDTPEWSAANQLAGEVPIVRAGLRMSSLMGSAGFYLLLGALYLGWMLMSLGPSGFRQAISNPFSTFYFRDDAGRLTTIYHDWTLALAYLGFLALIAIVLALVFAAVWGGRHARLLDHAAAVFSPLFVPVAAIDSMWKTLSEPPPSGPVTRHDAGPATPYDG